MKQKSIAFKILILLVSVACLAAIDQVTKYIAVKELSDGKIDVIKDFFTLDLIYNKGVAFGMLKGFGMLLFVIPIIICVVLIILYLRLPDNRRYRFIKIDFIFLIAGAVGNMIDRVMSGQVTDFLSFKFGDYYFPTFNVADIYVTVSVFALFLLILFYYKESEVTEIIRFGKGDS